MVLGMSNINTMLHLTQSIISQGALCKRSGDHVEQSTHFSHTTMTYRYRREQT